MSDISEAFRTVHFIQCPRCTLNEKIKCFHKYKSITSNSIQCTPKTPKYVLQRRMKCGICGKTKDIICSSHVTRLVPYYVYILK